MNFNEKEFANRVALTCHTIVACVLLLAYMLEWLKGARTLGYILIVFLLTAVPVAAEWIIRSKNREGVIIRHVMAITYSILYIFAIFTTNSILTFVYAIPMFVAITIYSDVTYGAIISIGGLLSNVAYIIYHAVTVGYASEEVPDVEIRIACMALVGLFMFLTTRANKKIGQERMREVQEHQDKTEGLLESVLEASDGMTADIAAVTDKMQLLGKSVERIREAMGEVSEG
ncbi:MAG: hypothetical protein IJ833_00510, partial [Lachnospiraceae bacterium]|nr:hypothetical protein [Lachnospiraceae bacterium]